jgi:hypothetical protein
MSILKIGLSLVAEAARHSAAVGRASAGYEDGLKGKSPSKIMTALSVTHPERAKQYFDAHQTGALHRITNQKTE